MDAKQPVICPYCGLKYKNNLSGGFSTHLEKKHDMTLRDYVIKHELNNIVPKCACGNCDEPAVFTRGAFTAYAKDHRRHDVRERLYRAKYGDPVCNRKGCDNLVKFKRGEPKRFCSSKCLGLTVGFGDETVQKKISETVQCKYGVISILQLPHIRHLHSIRMKQLRAEDPEHFVPNDVTRKKLGERAKKRWKNRQYATRVSRSIKIAILNNTAELSRRSLWMKAKRADSAFCENLFKNCKTRLSNLHRRIREKLQLDELGFISEQYLEGYFVDELLPEKRIVIEINGDYIHANPKKYNPDFVVRLRGHTYTAQEKWDKDKRRLAKLETAGYRVFVIWESDDIVQIREQLVLLCEQ